MQHKKTILFSVIVVSALCFISCGHDSKESIAFSKNTTTQTTFDTKDTNINNTMEILDDDSQGKKSSSRTMASGISMEFFCNDSPLPNMVYGHIRDKSEFGNYFLSIYKSLDEDVEYIAFVNEEGFAEDVLCWICSYDKKYVGIAKKYNSNLKDDFENWNEVLEYFDLKEGEYTNIYSDENEKSATTLTLDKEDPDIADSCILAYSLAREYALNYSDKSAVYGIRSKEEKFTKNTQWDIPSHGDIEYIIIYDASGGLYRVLCWDTDRDKKYVGDSELGESGDNIAEMNWDEVLEKYGFTQGSYTT